MLQVKRRLGAYLDEEILKDDPAGDYLRLIRIESSMIRNFLVAYWHCEVSFSMGENVLMWEQIAWSQRQVGWHSQRVRWSSAFKFVILQSSSMLRFERRSSFCPQILA